MVKVTQLLEADEALNMIIGWHEEEHPECARDRLSWETYKERNQWRLRADCSRCDFYADIPVEAR